MKILYVTDIMAVSGGGTPSAVRGYCKMLASRGVLIELVTTNIDHSGSLLPPDSLTEWHRDGYRQMFFPVMMRRLAFSPSLAVYLSRQIKKFDIIHIHGLYRFPQTIAAILARENRIPYIISTHGALNPFIFHKRERIAFKRLYEEIFEIENLKRAACIHYTSEEEMLLAENNDIYKTPGFVAPNIVDVKEYDDLPPRGSFRDKYNLNGFDIILFCGRLSKVKGLDLLLKAFSRIWSGRKNVRLVIVGPDNECFWPKFCLPLIKDLGCELGVVNLGMLIGDDLKSAYQDADVLSLTSYSENFGMVAVEAMLCGTPVLISNKVNIWRDIKSMNSGAVVDCTEEAVCAGLIKLLSDKDALKVMGSEAKRAASLLYSSNRTVSTLIRRYQDTVERCNW
jgi:glycosyltransferase involved in cell wall biosynthesis